MKKLCVLAVTMLAIAAVPSAFAKKGDAKARAKAPAKAKASTTVPSAVFAKYDTNNNGFLDAGEKAALGRAFDADKTGPLKTWDTNKDGKLSDDEMAAIPANKATDAPAKAKGNGRGNGKGKKNK